MCHGYREFQDECGKFESFLWERRTMDFQLVTKEDLGSKTVSNQNELDLLRVIRSYFVHGLN